MDFDPIHNGPAFRAHVSSARRPGRRETNVVSLGFGEVISLGGVTYQAVPFLIDPTVRDHTRNRHPLVEPDAGHRAVPLGTPALEDVVTGERRFGEHDERYDGISAPVATAWGAERRIRFADSLVNDPGRRVEAYGQYLTSIELGGATAAIAHLRLAEWQARDGFALPTQSTAELAPPDPARSITAHLIAAAGGDPAIRHRAGDLALSLAGSETLRGAGIASIDAVASRARECGDADWAAHMAARGAVVIAGTDRGRAVRWIAPALASAMPLVRAAGIEAAVRVVDAARLTQDEVVVRSVVALVDAAALTAEERRPLVERIAQAGNEMQGRTLDSLVFNVEGRIGDAQDLRLVDDINRLVAAGGRWRDGVARIAVNHAADRRSQRGRRHNDPVPAADEAYRRLLDTAIHAADLAGETVCGDIYGMDFASALGADSALQTYAYIHRALGSADAAVRARALDMAMPVAALGEAHRPLQLRRADDLEALATPEAAALLRATGLTSRTAELGGVAHTAPLVGHPRLDPTWTAASGHAAPWSASAPVHENAPAPVITDRPAFGLLSRFRGQPQNPLDS